MKQLEYLEKVRLR